MKIKSARALHARLAPRPHYYQSITPAMPARNFAYGSDRNNISDTGHPNKPKDLKVEKEDQGLMVDRLNGQ